MFRLAEAGLPYSRLAGRLGYRPEELVGRSARDLVFPEDVPDGERHWAERSRGAEGLGEFRLRHRDGAEVWFRAATCPLRDDDDGFAADDDDEPARLAIAAQKTGAQRKGAANGMLAALTEDGPLDAAR